MRLASVLPRKEGVLGPSALQLVLPTKEHAWPTHQGLRAEMSQFTQAMLAQLPRLSSRPDTVSMSPDVCDMHPGHIAGWKSQEALGLGKHQQDPRESASAFGWRPRLRAERLCHDHRADGSGPWALVM